MITNLVASLLISTNVVLIDAHPSHEELFLATAVVAHPTIKATLEYDGQSFPISTPRDWQICLSSNLVRIPPPTNTIPVSTNEQPNLRNPRGTSPPRPW